MRGKKLGYLIPEFPGQTHIWMWREIQWMRRWGVEVALFSTRRPPTRDAARHAFAEAASAETCYLWPPSPAKATAAATRVLAMNPGGLLRATELCRQLAQGDARRLAHLLGLLAPASVLADEAQRRGLAHIHVHSCADSAILCMLAKRLTGVSFSLTLNANIEWWGEGMAQKFADATFTIAITQWLLEQMRREFPELGEDQALLGRIGVDTQKWQPVPRPARSEDRPFRLATVGRLHASKGHDVLLRAVKRLLERGRAVVLTVLGEGPERASLERFVAEAGLGEQVRFLGSQPEDEVIRQLQEADAFVLASHAEPLGVVYMEAMAMGLPTIGTAAGGVPEIITDGEDGLLAPPRDDAALAATIERVMDDEALRRKLAEAGRRTIEQRFDARLGAATLYERLFGEEPPDGVQASEAESGEREALAA